MRRERPALPAVSRLGEHPRTPTLSDTMYLLIILRKSTPPQDRELIVYYQ